MKQTAVEWLIQQYENDFPLTFDAMEQAKAMEKEQIVEAYRTGVEEDVLKVIKLRMVTL